MVKVFDKSQLKKLYKSSDDSSKGDNGQITIVGGSSLFHGAPLLSLKVASRICDMVFFATPEKSVGYIAEKIKSKLLSFIWIPWDEVETYIGKSNACLVGPGFMRYGRESQNLKAPPGQRPSRVGDKSPKVLDEEGKRTREITKRLLQKFPDKKWVIDAGSLQVMDLEWIPENAILTPNKKEFELLFKTKPAMSNVKLMAKMYKCVIVAKEVETIVCMPDECVLVKGGNSGLTKGGTGDVLAGLTAALFAKNDPFLAAASATYIIKATADELYKKVGTNYNADDLVDAIPEVLKNRV